MTSITQSTLVNFSLITKADIADLISIENACHSHPWSEKTFISCIGGSYFGEKLSEETSAPITENQAVTPQKKTIVESAINCYLGFYVGQYIAGEATLMDICVLPSHQGKGYGKVLLTQFLAQAKQQGATKIFLEVRAKNIAAQMLYMNAGFIEIDRRTGYYPSAKGFGYEDAIVMSLKC